MSCAYHPRIKYHVGGGVQAKAAGGANNDWKLTHTLVHAHKGSDGSSPSLQVCLFFKRASVSKTLRPHAYQPFCMCVYVFVQVVLHAFACVCAHAHTLMNTHEHEVGEKGREKSNGSHVHKQLCIRA
jgi:hypothetical protein